MGLRGALVVMWALWVSLGRSSVWSHSEVFEIVFLSIFRVVCTVGASVAIWRSLGWSSRGLRDGWRYGWSTYDLYSWLYSATSVGNVPIVVVVVIVVLTMVF